MASVFSVISVLIVTLIYLSFFAQGLTLFQNLAIIAVVILALVAVLGLLWIPWGMRFAQGGPDTWAKWEKFGKKMEKEHGEDLDEFSCFTKNPRQFMASKIIGALFLSWIIIYFAFYAQGYTLFQSIALIAVAALLWGGFEAAIRMQCMRKRK
jgi:hypothetical protein